MNWYRTAQRVRHPFLLDFPDNRQADDFMCGPAVLESVLSYYGFNLREYRLAEELNTTFDNGTEHEEIAKLAKELGLKIDARSMTPNDVISYLEKHIPVILYLQAWAKDDIDYAKHYRSPHFVVAIGYDKAGIYCEDPWLAEMGYISFEDLSQRWHSLNSQGDKVKNIGIAIFGAKPKYTSNKALEIR